MPEYADQSPGAFDLRPQRAVSGKEQSDGAMFSGTNR